MLCVFKVYTKCCSLPLTSGTRCTRLVKETKEIDGRTQRQTRELPNFKNRRRVVQSCKFCVSGCQTGYMHLQYDTCYGRRSEVKALTKNFFCGRDQPFWQISSPPRARRKSSSSTEIRDACPIKLSRLYGCNPPGSTRKGEQLVGDQHPTVSANYFYWKYVWVECLNYTASVWLYMEGIVGSVWRSGFTRGHAHLLKRRFQRQSEDKWPKWQRGTYGQ